MPNINLAWDANPEPDITNYRLYAGTQSGVYNDAASPKDMGNTTTGFYAFASPGAKYMALTAVNPSGESGFSNEVFTTILGAIPPARAFVGAG